MKLYLYEGKNEEETFEKMLKDLNSTVDDILYKKEKVKGSLFKAETYKYSAVKLTDIVSYIKNVLSETFKNMNLEVTYETNIRDKQINIVMFSNNNSILIGKFGKTLSSLTVIMKQAVYNQIGMYPYLNLDVEGYKSQQIKHIERLAKNIAREVKNTNTPVTMENMNSYERRIVHNTLTNYKGVTTISEGVDPNRRVVVKPKKD